jgi:serine/threonine-protein kinase
MTNHCQECGISVEPGIAICWRCQSLQLQKRGAINKKKNEIDEFSDEPASTASVSMAACPRCGTPLIVDAEFCEGCGVSFVETEVVESGLVVDQEAAKDRSSPMTATRDVPHRDDSKSTGDENGGLGPSENSEVAGQVSVAGKPRQPVSVGPKRRLGISLAAVLLIGIGTAAWFAFQQDSTPRDWLASLSERFSRSATPPPPEGMVFIPGGAFLMGRNGGDEYERPEHQVTVAPFFLDKFEVTCEEYQKFVDETGHRPPPSWTKGRFSEGEGRLPVTGVSWDDATAFALWAGKRLPTEEEWEFAARGTNGRLYPWGNQWIENTANVASAGYGKPVEVGSFAGSASPFGIHDMIGNVWEWTGSEIHSYPGGKIQEDGLSAADRARLKVIRGGCFLSGPSEASTTYRMGYAARGRDYSQTGFRCAKDVGP